MDMQEVVALVALVRRLALTDPAAVVLVAGWQLAPRKEGEIVACCWRKGLPSQIVA